MLVLDENFTLGKAGFGTKSMEYKGLFSLKAFLASVSCRGDKNLVEPGALWFLLQTQAWIWVCGGVSRDQKRVQLSLSLWGEKIHICFYFPLKNSQTVLWAIKYWQTQFHWLGNFSQAGTGRGRDTPDPRDRESRAGEGCSHHSWECGISSLSPWGASLFLEV